jgi:hypothetical protein
VTSRYLLGFTLASCAILADLLARRDKSYEKFAYGLMTLTIADFVRFKLSDVWGEPRPYTGVRRVLFHLDEGLFLLWPMALAYFLYDILGKQEDALRKTAYAWIIFCVALVVGYPEPFRGDLLVNTLYPSIHVLAVVSTVPTIAYWTLYQRTKKSVDYAVLWLWVGAVADLAGTYWLRDTLRFWSAGQWVSVATYSALAVMLGVQLMRGRRGTRA